MEDPLQLMTWNGEQPDWPNFTYDSKALEPLERQFLRQSGEFVGAYKHIGADDQETLKIELISEEAVKTSEIEGEILNRDSVQSSLRAQFGLGAEAPNVKPAERGISKMMIDLYRGYADPLTDQTMFDWHKMLLAGDKDIKVIGGYRTHPDAMQVASGPVHKRTVHFEAPPSARVPAEMKRLIIWFNDTAPSGKTPLPALTRAALAHLYFVSIHPFEDGNGRIGRALAEKSLAQNLGQPSLIALAYTIERKHKDYYAALERNNRAGAQQQGPPCRRLDDVFREHGLAGAGQHDRARGLLHRQGQVLREIPRQAQRTPVRGHRPRVSRGHRRLQGWPQRRELHRHQQDLARDRDARPTRPR
jgi:Fic family protein